MKVLNLEVICCLRAFQQLMLNLFDNDILAIEHDENITGSEVNCACPTLLGGIERMLRFLLQLSRVTAILEVAIIKIFANCCN